MMISSDVESNNEIQSDGLSPRSISHFHWIMTISPSNRLPFRTTAHSSISLVLTPMGKGNGILLAMFVLITRGTLRRIRIYFRFFKLHFQTLIWFFGDKDKKIWLRQKKCMRIFMHDSIGYSIPFGIFMLQATTTINFLLSFTA